MPATVIRIDNHGSIVTTILQSETGYHRVNWDWRSFKDAWDGGLRPGSNVTIHETDDGTAVELED
jgi:hypothetical protein